MSTNSISQAEFEKVFDGKIDPNDPSGEDGGSGVIVAVILIIVALLAGVGYYCLKCRGEDYSPAFKTPA